ncbi:hypothetical protein AURDEDRAFT_163670 [Auricularia subglabra TFB-10046 SS5]|nr:hypothetical protein AURDEDRAFT_163670 [Auricularia subglabra TFB-10046 SS5]
MREPDSRTARPARARTQRIQSPRNAFRAADVLGRRERDTFAQTLAATSAGRAARSTKRALGRARRDDDDSDSDGDSDSDDDNDEKKGKKKKGKAGGSGKKKDKGSGKKGPHSIQPPAPHHSPPSSPPPHPPAHFPPPPPHGPPPKGPHPPFHPPSGAHPHPKVALSSRPSADDPLTTPVAKPSDAPASSTTEEPSSPESVQLPPTSHHSQTHAAGTPLSTPPGSSPTATDGGHGAIASSMSPAPSGAPIHASGGKKGFPLAAAGALGGVLSFLIVSGIVWGLWFWRRRRRRTRAPPAQWDFQGSPQRPMSDGVTVETHTTRTISTTLPQFASAAEADRNPFSHPADGLERDPFTGAPTLRLGTMDAPISRMFV